MVNPDTKTTSGNTMTFATPVAVLFLIGTIVLFLFRDSLGTSFKYALWLGIPLIGYVICSAVNLLSQYMSCSKINAGKAFLGGLTSLGTIFVALGIASISSCRIPVASVFAPLIVGKPVDITQKNATATVNSLKNSNSKECCVPKLTLEATENQYPIISGISYGFYLMFAVLFGQVFGGGIADAC